MLFFHGFLQLFADDVRVDLRGRDVGVAEHLLDRAQVGTIREQVRRKCVTQDVRADFAFLKARIAREVLQELREALAGQVAAVRRAGREYPFFLAGFFVHRRR